ncbi:MAG: hypothetical protein Q7S27_05640 [Nanoarchaeota archaeon]|nr:hypothetical protein [Nanoarchaeota archaeon]
MENFDKNKVLERILQDAPILTNIKKLITISVNNYNNKGDLNGKKKVKSPIYAFYGISNVVSDPELKYDRENNPIKTTPNSSLSEIYSFWNPHVKGNIERGWSNCPFMDMCLPEDAPANARKVAKFEFRNSGLTFTNHFNAICEKLKYEPRLVNEIENGDLFFWSVEIPSEVTLDYNGKTSRHDSFISMPVGINYNVEDPPLSKVINSISKAYDKLNKRKFSSVNVKLNS